MPNYEFKCDRCKTVEEKNLPIAERNNTQFCAKCGNPMERKVSITHLSGFDQYGTST